MLSGLEPLGGVMCFARRGAEFVMRGEGGKAYEMVVRRSVPFGKFFHPHALY
jgi:hypothetical protein